jgi:uncharacterized MAPEG superfamily protein
MDVVLPKLMATIAVSVWYPIKLKVARLIATRTVYQTCFLIGQSYLNEFKWLIGAIDYHTIECTGGLLCLYAHGIHTHHPKNHFDA